MTPAGGTLTIIDRIEEAFSSGAILLTRLAQAAILVGGNYATWDARFAYKLMAKLFVTAAIDNLANASYMQPLGYPALSRAARVGLRVGL